MYSLYIKVTSLILNVTVHLESHNSSMETSECFVFGKIYACIAIFGNIGKSNSNSIVDIVIHSLGNFALIIFFVGCTLLSWADTAMKIPVHPEPATAEFSSFFLVRFLWLALQQYFYIHMYFQINCKFYHYRLINYVFYHPHRHYFIRSSTRVPYFFVIPPLGCIA